MPLHVAALLGAFSLLSVARADGNVGCLFSETLCLDKVEWCFDDLAFGRCVQRNADEEDLHRFSSLTHSQLHELKQELHRLLALGYRWNHPHTQCRLQGMLYALHHGLDFEPEQCIHLIDRQLEEIPFEDIETEEEMDEPVAYVRFTPSVADPHADFADEIYYPAPEDEMLAVEPIDENFIETRVSNIPTNQLLAEVIGEIDDSDMYNSQQSYDNMPHPEMTKKSTRDLEELAFIPAMHRRSSRDAIFSREYNTPQDFRLGQETRDLLNVLPQFPDNKSPYLTENSDPSGLSFNIDPETFLRAQADHMYPPGQSVIGYSDNFDGTDRFMTRPLTESDPNAMNFDTRYMESDDGPNIVDPDDADDSEQDIEEFLPVIEYLNKLHLRPDDMEYLLKPENVDILRSLLPDDFEENDGTFQKSFNTIPDDALIQTWLDSEEAQRLRNKLAQIRAYNRMNSRGVFEKTNDAQHMLDYTNDAPEQRIYYEDDDNYEDAGSTVPEPEFFRTVDEIPVGLSQTEENNQSPFREMHTTQNMNENNDKEIFRELKFKEKSHTNPEHDSNDFLQLGNKFQPRHPEENLKAGVYTEGGIVFVPETPETGNLAQNDEALNEEIMSELDNDDWGFKRRERLDVKKPGPPFNTKPHPQTEHININNEIKSNDISETKVKKELSHDNEFNAITELNSHDQYDVDTSYAYMDFKNSLKTWREGNHIVNVLAELLHLKHESFSHTRIERNEVTFKVEPNNLGLNASTVALKIDELKDALKERTGVEVTSAGIGDKTKLPVVRWAAITPTGDAWVFTEGRVLLAGCLLAAIVLAGGTLALLRRHAASRRKLQDLAAGDVSGHDTEASRDYQDLCRSRMASKGAQPTSSTASGEKPESVHGRITSLSRESEGGSQQSPSSRSSTSSWSEEPALSNMDISTGHMVLSYMEDHLKNKDRLEQEWVALCAYEAEPCATTEATRPENIEKNRNPHVLPYDHSRVVLGQLANAAGSDYINASTITDHDPRNPAYIATQGPLPNTAADFWQMIWEQGSVVMVMLTRLTEGGVAMCHRYWPEEGSELYHIYEVHLVSEHIWCDDYLVRSFYLKNIKTGETRTVTQFHFLSWPDMGVPASTKALLEFRRKVNKSYRGRSCPIVVHCSDGAGRTGTYSLIDMVLNRMAKGAKEIDIAATLEHIRDQRPVMVATRQQFEFVLTAVAEEVHAILKALPPGPTPPSTATSTTAEKL